MRPSPEHAHPDISRPRRPGASGSTGLVAALEVGPVGGEPAPAGADTRIDPATGDVSIKDVTVDRIRRNADVFETVVSVS
jgi:hypothetical protein